MKKDDIILLTGASGLVGSYLLPLLKDKYETVFATRHQEVPHTDKERTVSVDLTNSKDFGQLLNQLSPNAIINLAAFTDVDGCEKNRDLALSINRDVVGTITSYIKKHRHTYLLHVSTDYVFDGKLGNYLESSETKPLNSYGISKLQGELKIQNNLRDKNNYNWCIARTSTPFGLHNKKKSFPILVLERLSNSETVNALSDQYTSPTYCLELARSLSETLQKGISGLIHIAGRSKLTRYEQALKISEVFGLNAKLIRAVYMSDMNWAAERPHDSTLNIDRASSLLRRIPQEFDVSLYGLLEELSS